MQVHAYRRNPTEVIDIEFAGRVLHFGSNSAGHVVAEIEDEIAEELIKRAPCGFKPYGETPAATRSKSNEPLRFDRDLDDEDDEPKTPTGGAPDAGEGGTGGEGTGSAESKAFVITSPDGEKFDLSPLSDEEVRAFAEKVGAPKPHHMKKGDALKQAVIDSLRALPAE